MIKKILKIAGIIVLVILVAVAGLLTYVKTALPNISKAADITIELSPERIERGKYLATNVAACMDCHSKRDWTLYAAPPIDGTIGMGGEPFDQTFGFPGAFYSKNITPAGIGNWTDGEVLRAITTGVNKDGKALFPVMPHPGYGVSDEEDIKSIIAYVRTLQPIENTVKESVPDFPMNFIINTIPKEAAFTKRPEPTDTVNYGKYLVTLASCSECHTKHEKGQVVGKPFAGGFEFPFPSGDIIRSANITPDKETGIGNWNKQAFISRFKSYADSAGSHIKVAEGGFQTIMPWTMYGGMKEEDLGAIYAYLQTVEPVNNQIVRVTPAAK